MVKSGAITQKKRVLLASQGGQIAPSILSADFSRLAAHAKQALDGGGTLLHVDIMDGHFVPNITIGPPVVASLRKALPTTIFDCHLMIENPDELVPAFAEAGASWISVHQEACVHLDRVLHHIMDHGCKAGVLLNPAPPVDTLTDVLDLVHHVLVMSVNPGFGGQKFIRNSLKKMQALARMREERRLDFRIEVDGGVAMDTVEYIVRAGGGLLGDGNAVFVHGDAKKNAKQLLDASSAATLTRA